MRNVALRTTAAHATRLEDVGTPPRSATFGLSLSGQQAPAPCPRHEDKANTRRQIADLEALIAPGPAMIGQTGDR